MPKCSTCGDDKCLIFPVSPKKSISWQLVFMLKSGSEISVPVLWSWTQGYADGNSLWGCIVLIGHSSIWFMNSQQNFFCFCHGALPLPFSCVFSWIVAVIQLTAYLYSLYRSVSFRAVKLRRVWKEARTTILMFEKNVTCNCTSLQIAVELVGGFKT